MVSTYELRRKITMSKNAKVTIEKLAEQVYSYQQKLAAAEDKIESGNQNMS